MLLELPRDPHLPADRQEALVAFCEAATHLTSVWNPDEDLSPLSKDAKLFYALTQLGILPTMAMAFYLMIHLTNHDDAALHLQDVLKEVAAFEGHPIKTN